MVHVYIALLTALLLKPSSLQEVKEALYKVYQLSNDQAGVVKLLNSWQQLKVVYQFGVEEELVGASKIWV